jgi:thiol-disulfide isomerase/thioredoxin
MTSSTPFLVGGLAAGLSALAVGATEPQQLRPTSAEAAQNEVCLDSQGGESSPGGSVTVNGKTWQCVVGPHWVPEGSAAGAVLQVGDANLAADTEAAILAALTGPSLPPLRCDAVLNSDAGAGQLLQLAQGEKRLVLFWTPTCGPCKPVMADMAALAALKPKGLSFLGVVQAIEPDLEPPGDAPLERVKGIVAKYDVHFATCVHTSREQTRKWRAQGVPLVLVVSQKGVERVALGGRNGARLVAEWSGHN